MRFLVPLGPGYWLATITAVDRRGRTRRLRDGRLDVLQVAAPPELRVYQRENRKEPS